MEDPCFAESTVPESWEIIVRQVEIGGPGIKSTGNIVKRCVSAIRQQPRDAVAVQDLASADSCRTQDLLRDGTGKKADEDKKNRQPKCCHCYGVPS
jgi:3-keto-L-gulonate-6-phosphate decarboxylase